MISSLVIFIKPTGWFAKIKSFLIPGLIFGN
jgi:hypothetical protein